MRGLARDFRSFVVALVVLLFASQAMASGAQDVVRVIGDDFAAAAEVGQANPQAGQAAAARVLDKWFSVRAMATAALPDAFRKDIDAGYIAAYRDHLAAEFVKRTLRAGNGGLNPIGERSAGALTMVGTQVIEDGRVVRMLEFYMQPNGASFRVNNVSVEGVLITAQQQKNFNPHLISGGVPGLTAHLSGSR